MTRKIDWFTAKWCVPCKNLKPFMVKVCSELGIEFNQLDIDTPEGDKAAKAADVKGVPTMFINGIRHDPTKLTKSQIRQLLSDM